MQLYGLIGYPLGHSFSQKYFSEKFAREGIGDAHFELFPIRSIAELPALLSAHPDLRGLSVTIPHKESVTVYLDELDETARAVGAVNCIRIKNGRLTGFNTDVIGFGQSLAAINGGQWASAGSSAIILGTGGASKAVAFVLKNLGMDYLFVSRSPEGASQISYEAFHRLSPGDYSLIVHTTPLGTYPEVNNCPDLPFRQLGAKHLVYDLVYNPPETLLLQRAGAQGCAV